MAKYRYNNINNVSTDKTLKQLKQLQEERRKKKKDYSFIIPNMKPDLEFLNRNRTIPTLTWIGHSTFFIQYEGLNIVTDPVWAPRMGLKRRLGVPGVQIEDMPPVDLILISHSHYDHLHLASIRQLYQAKTRIIVPAGLKKKLCRKGFSRCVEMNWWERLQIGNVSISFVPTQHWTRRTLFDTNSSHWGGYVLEKASVEEQVVHPDRPHPPAKVQVKLKDDELGYKAVTGMSGQLELSSPPVIYFAGDSGYFTGFKEIGERYNLDVALLPIGAYEPEWFMTPQHTTPEEAIQAFQDCHAKMMIPMHYGTFKLADDTAREALDRLEQERLRCDIPEEILKVMIHGETLKLPYE